MPRRSLLWAAATACAMCSATSDDAFYTPWSDSGQATTDSPMLLHSANGTHPVCDRAVGGTTKPDCVYPILFALSSCFRNESVIASIESWIDRLRAITRDEAYLIDGQTCSLVWQTMQLVDDSCTKTTSKATLTSTPTSTPKQTPTRAPRSTPKTTASTRAPIAMHRYHRPEHRSARPAWFKKLAHVTPDGAVHGSVSLTAWVPRPNGALIEAQGRQLLHALLPEKRIVALLPTDDGEALVAALAHDRGVTAVSSIIVANDDLAALVDLDLVQWPHLDTWYYCSSQLLHGKPTLYLDANGTRHCVCRCPSGQDVALRASGAACEPVVEAPSDGRCVHANRTFVYEIASPSIDRDDRNQCHIRRPPSMVHVPFPLQTSTTIAIHVRAATNATADVYAGEVPSSPSRALDNVVWKSPGAYNIDIASNGTSCRACLVIRDLYRPRSTQTCPNVLCESSVCAWAAPGLAEYTLSNLAAAQANVDQHVTYGLNAENDACSAARCDLKTFARRDFFELNETNDRFDRGQTWLQAPISLDVGRRLEASPFGADDGKLQLHSPVAPYQCTRCSHLQTTLRELWVPYTDCRSATPAPECSGSDVGCTTHQCLVASGTTLFMASATIAPAYAATTAQLIKELYPTLAYNGSQDVHIQLDCFALGDTDATCAHNTTLYTLLTLSSGLVDHSLLANMQPDGARYVYWRHRIDYGPWMNSAKESILRFHQHETTLHVQAWSQCGLVTEASVQIHLHTRAPVCVTNAFPTMWYQTSVVDAGSDVFCASTAGFAEVTFDFDPSMGLQCAETTPSPWTFERLRCDGRYATTSKKAVLVDARSAVVRRFAVYLDPLATHATTLNITCAFTYSSVGYATTHTELATTSLRIVACAGDTVASAAVCQGVVVDCESNRTRVQYVSKRCDGAAVCKPMLALPVDDYDSAMQLASTQDIYTCLVVDDALLLLASHPASPFLGGLGIFCLLVGLVAGVHRHRNRPVHHDTDYYVLVDA
ncbi:hypothetical protein SDRG_04318 [Saprolegnia diclina VS20]|uniref:Uncharacterized protein n=1 Tax=Saprolegnia diclina (strain VS20) TaxID=1156394 RepID=T0S7E1_SAPDV|nr:hypothetical protein SDRG_04318 [Saprolegnia diclina VS20]EQC38617.1 hypothetical protein SDRG_04318 [Saprolegnia diclina VS20]|eukprot:XP_008608209.1 hypothetical protein SDRG_04318 [Saprolegnia diclina VS20]